MALAPARRARDPEQTRRDILDAARAEFAENGLSGARVDAIAARTRSTVRMIYYYFGSKDGLYRAVIEEAYRRMRRAEGELGLDGLEPADAVRRLVEFVFDYQEENADFTRLVSIENVHRASHILRSEAIGGLNATVIERLSALLERGERAGAFRPGVEPRHLHMLMTSFPFFRVANRYTLATIFGADPLAPETRDAQREMAVAAVLGYLAPQAPSSQALAPRAARAPMGERRVGAAERPARASRRGAGGRLA